ncbi:MAG: prepilin-type N-terminal cleavage/methylation domain-containing protein [Elusimicrobia bacterium]|nr:prepilin-type N-terminal cleavage/methylation domain-containing protein [Elusimicrobiota bacterium]
MKKIKKKVGFTLIELVIVITLVTILSVISVPIYNNYIRDTKRSEAYIFLSRLRDAQQEYYHEYGTFYNSTYTSNDTVLKVDARNNKYFTWFHPGYGANSLGYIVWLYLGSYSNGTGWHGMTLKFNLSEGYTMWEY